VCHAVRAPGSNVTIAPLIRAGSLPLNGESMRTEPVNQSSGPLTEATLPILLISICVSLPLLLWPTMNYIEYPGFL